MKNRSHSTKKMFCNFHIFTYICYWSDYALYFFSFISPMMLFEGDVCFFANVKYLLRRLFVCKRGQLISERFLNQSTNRVNFFLKIENNYFIEYNNNMTFTCLFNLPSINNNHYDQSLMVNVQIWLQRLLHIHNMMIFVKFFSTMNIINLYEWFVTNMVIFTMVTIMFMIK